MTATIRPSNLELFGLKDAEGRYYLYAPLEHAAAVVNAAAVAAVKSFLEHGESSLSPVERAVIEQLRKGGLIRDKPADKPVAPTDYLFRPCEVTLFPTTRCNLRCVYCYANAGDTQQEMPWEAAKAAIDLVADNAASMGRADFVVGFHGGGEPMLNWSLVTRCVEYAHQIAGQRALKVHIHAASNGLLTTQQCEFIAKYFSGINLSIDGPHDIQDTHRPRLDGGGSFDRVMETVRRFEKAKFPYGVRATITDRSILRMTEIVRFVREACPSIDQLHVEPVWCCGRCKTSGTKTPDHAVFVDRFLEAWDEGKRIGLNLFYSGSRLDAITNKFCAAPGDGFSVTPDGIVTSCFEVTRASDSRSTIFHYGKYDHANGQYVFDLQQIAKLRKLTVEHIPHCGECFCKWHCAGDCLAKVMTGHDPLLHQGSTRCELNRAITFAEIRRIVGDTVNTHAQP